MKNMCRETQMQKNNGFGFDLFWLSLCPVVLPHFTYEDTVLGSVDQQVKRQKGHDAGQTETARVNLHTNLRSDKDSITKPVYFTHKSNLKSYIWLFKESMYNSKLYLITKKCKSYQVIFVLAFAFDISIATNCIQRELIREFTL